MHSDYWNLMKMIWQSQANTYYKLFNPEGELCFNLYDPETNAFYELYKMEAEAEGCYKQTYILITLRLCNASAEAHFLNYPAYIFTFLHVRPNWPVMNEMWHIWSDLYDLTNIIYKHLICQLKSRIWYLTTTIWHRYMMKMVSSAYSDKCDM